MRIAKASAKDLEVAMEISGFLEALESRWMPEGVMDDQPDAAWFDAENPEHCQRVLVKLLKISAQGSLGRVVFGMSVLLDPNNEVVDPDADHLALHPKIAGLLHNLAPTP